MAKAIVEGGKDAAAAMKDILASAGSLASAQAGGKTGADIRALETSGSKDDFVTLQKANSAMQTAQSMASVKANQGAGFLDASGNVTTKGTNAFSISPTEMAGQLGVKEDVLFGKNAGTNIVEQIKKASITAEKSEKDINSALHSYGLTDANGENAASGLDLVGGLAKMGAMNYSSSKALSFMGMTMSANIDSEGNAKVVKADGGTAVNTADIKTSGHSEKVDDSMSVSTGVQLRGTTLDLAAWAEVSSKMAGKYGKEAIVGAVADAKNGNFDNFRKMVEGTFGAKNGDSIADNLEAQWASGGESDRLGEALFAGAAITSAYGADKKFNSGRFAKALNNFGASANPFTSNESSQKGDNSQEYETDGEKSNNRHNNTPKQSFSGAPASEQVTMAEYTKNSKNSKGYSGKIKAAGWLGTAAVATDLLATGHVGEAFDAITEGVSDTFSKTVNGNIAGKTGAAANVGSFLFGRESMNNLADNKFSLSAMNALTNVTDGIGQMIDMGASAIATPFNGKTYEQNRDYNFSLSKSGANVVNSAASFMFLELN